MKFPVDIMRDGEVKAVHVLESIYVQQMESRYLRLVKNMKYRCSTSNKKVIFNLRDEQAGQTTLHQLGLRRQI